MNNWLSAYEEFSKAAHKLDVEEEASIKLNCVDRMARVLRELAKRNKEAQEICDGTPQGSEPRGLDDAITEILGVLGDNLSPDAKELLK